MKIVNLIGPAVIDGAVRYPIEGPLTVTDKVAQQLKDSNRLDGEPEDLPDDDASDEPEDDGLEGKGVPALKKIAKDEDIDLGPATDKPDIIAAIRTAREAKEG